MSRIVFCKTAVYTYEETYIDYIHIISHFLFFVNENMKKSLDKIKKRL